MATDVPSQNGPAQGASGPASDAMRACRDILDATGDAIVIHDAETGQIVDVNETMLRMFGCTREEVGRLQPSDLTTEDGGLSDEEAIRQIRLAAAGQTQRFEWSARKRTGEKFQAEVTLCRVEIGGRVRVLATVRDITSRVAVEDRLRVRERDLRNLIENVPGLVYRSEVEEPWRMLYMSEGALGITGRHAEAFVSGDVLFADIVLPEDLPTLAEAVSTGVARHEPFEIEYRVRYPEGGIRWVFQRGQATYSADGKATFIDGVMIDVTDRKLAEETSRQTEEQYRTLYAAMDEGFCLHVLVRDGERVTDYRIVDVNPSFTRITKIPREQVVGRLGTEVYGTAQAPYLDVYQRVAETGHPEWFETHFQPLNKHFSISVFSPSPDVFATVFYDITARKEAEEAARGERLRTQQYLDIAAVILVALDARALVTMINRRGLEVLGYAREEILGKNWVDLCVPVAIREDVQRTFDDLMAGRIELAERHENPVVTSKGVERRIAWHNALLRDDDGRITGTLSSGEDVTERWQAEEEQSRFFALSSALFIIAGTDGVIHRVNPAWEHALGRPASEMQGRLFLDFVHPDDLEATQEETAKLAAGTATYFFTNRYRHQNGAYRTLSWSAHPIAEQGLIYALAIDITEHRKMEERLRQSEKMGAIGQLAGGVAHDFNNQLGAILGYAELLHDRVDDPVLKRYAESILVASRRSADLTRQLLAFARKGQYQSLVVDMHAIVHEVVEMLERSIDKRIRIKQHLDANPSTVHGDPSQLQNALLNLGLNARDAMPDGGDLVFSTDVRNLDEAYCRTIPYEVVPGRYLQVRVTDNGVGMSREVQAHLFEPFFTTKEQGKGTGMGLAAVYGTVKNHRGFIEVISELDRGTTIELSIPIHDADVAADEKRPPAAETQHRVGRLLVVDDEIMIRDLAAEMLRSMGHQVTTCQDGAEALAYYKQHWQEIDLVILDMVMPGRSGRDTFLDMRRLNPAIKALLSSGFSVDGDAQRILDEGVLGFLQKPYTMRELTAKVGQLLR